MAKLNTGIYYRNNSFGVNPIMEEPPKVRVTNKETTSEEVLPQQEVVLSEDGKKIRVDDYEEST